MEAFSNHNFTLSYNGYLNIEMDWYKPGSFWMGMPSEQKSSNLYSYSMQFLATVSKGFWIGKYYITQEQWSYFSIVCEAMKLYEYEHNSLCPVYSISWLEAMLFCKELNIIFKDSLPKGYHFSLPTELHWEYTARVLNDASPKDIDIRANEKTGLLNQQLLMRSTKEWAFDPTSGYPRNPTIDWIGNQEDFWLGDDINDDEIIHLGKFRTERGNCSITFRQYTNYCDGVFPGKRLRDVCFRICLRPINMLELFDPLVKKHKLGLAK